MTESPLPAEAAATVHTTQQEAKDSILNKNFLKFHDPPYPLFGGGSGSIESDSRSLTFSIIPQKMELNQSSYRVYQLIAYGEEEEENEVLALMWNDSTGSNMPSVLIQGQSDSWPYKHDIHAFLRKAPYWDIRLPEAPSERLPHATDSGTG